MIPARTGITAEIAGDLVAVEAWDDEGRALILDREKGRLVPAETLPEFTGLHVSEVVSIIPGGGWRAYEGSDADARGRITRTRPVVAWGLKTDGSIEPYVCEGGDGIVEARQLGLRLAPPVDGGPQRSVR